MRRRSLLIDNIDGRDIIDSYEFVDLNLPSKLLWATCNVGGNFEEEYGNYYMYGKGQREYNSNDSIYSGTENPLASSADTATRVMGGSWRMPTREEFAELKNYTDSKWVNNFKESGINGVIYRRKGDSNKYIFFPANGRISNGSIGSQGTVCTIWTSTPSGSSNAYFYNIENGNTREYTITRSRGYGIRGVHDPI